MSEISTDTIDHVTDISDPGDRNRENHLWGDRLMINLGNIAAWLFPILMIAIVSQVFMRKFGFNQAWLDDAQWWIYGTALLTGFGYAITTDSHVRVDILHENYSTKKKARVELVALGWCLMPFLVLMTDILTHYAYSSILALEGSDSPNGLHGLFLLKSILPLLFAASIIAAFAALHRNLAVLRKPALWSLIIAALPTFWFMAERLTYYILWWFVRLTNSEIVPRRIGREPLLEPTMWYGLTLVIIVAVTSFILDKRRQTKAT